MSRPGVAAASYAGKPVVVLYPYGGLRGDSVRLTPEDAKATIAALEDALAICLHAHAIPVETVGESTKRTVIDD